MLQDARKVPSGKELSFDLCIIGAGVAGITLARDFVGSGRKVCLLESGGEEIDARVQNLYRGNAVLVDPDGRSLDISDYLTSSRFRVLGGSGNAWGGKCAVLDPSDLQERSWMPHSGWPSRAGSWTLSTIVPAIP